DAAPQPVPIFPLLGAGHLDQPLRGELTAGMLRVAGAAGDTTAWLTVLPDGRRLRLERPATDATAPPVALVRGPRTITITLFDAEGGPVPNIPVHAVERADGPGLRAVVVSDAAGRAVFPGLHFGAIEFVILLGQWQGSPRQQPVGVIAAGTDDVAASFTFTRSRHVELQLRIDGEPRLPAAIEIATPHGLVGPLTEDSARATVGFEVWPNRGVDEVPLLVRAPGCRSAAFVVDRVPAATHEQRLDLESLGEIRVTVTAPADGEYRLALEAVPPGKRQWYTVRDVHFARVGPHAFRLEGTPAGRYRVRDRLSGTATAPFEVGRGIATTALELGDLGWATGTVTLPPDVEPSELTITDPAGERVAGLELDARNGTFRSRLAAAVPLVVRVAHPRCAAALATLTRATPCAVALRRLPDVCFRLSTGGEATVRVRVGDRRQPVVDTRITPDAAGSYSFAAPSGTHAVRIDVPGRAPIELAALEVTGTLDLGLLVPPTGLSIVVRLAVRAEMLPPTLIATIRDRDGDIVQTVTNDGRAEFAIDGLLPGPCTLELTNAAGETLHVRRQRELDVAPGMAAVAIDLRGNRKR
ncbi:MAG: hypothetical protein KDE27_25225, partial [Planctomycetes bacterium]|nr:hypothetical protein [Planctomycetota bacterium]